MENKINSNDLMQTWFQRWDEMTADPNKKQVNPDDIVLDGVAYFYNERRDIDFNKPPIDPVNNPSEEGPKGPDPKWVKEDFLKEISQMKDKLFDLENKLAALGATGDATKVTDGDVSDLQKQVDNLRDKVDKALDDLGR